MKAKLTKRNYVTHTNICVLLHNIDILIMINAFLFLDSKTLDATCYPRIPQLY